MAFLEKLAYMVGVDTDAAAADFTRIQRMIDGLGEQAKKTFERDIGRSLANSVDPKNLESDLAKAKAVLARFGKEAGDTFNKTLGRNVARSLTGETSKFAEQLKATLGQSFSLKNFALGSAAGLGIASLASSLLEAGKAAVRFAADFELALAQVQAIADDGFNTQAVGEDLKALAQQVPQDLISLTKGLGDIIGSGVTDASDALKVLEISAKAAVAGLTDTATSSRGIVFVLNAYGKSAEEAAGISDILFKTVDEGVINFEELTGVIGDVAGPAAQAGIEFGEIGAAIAFLTKQGISGAEATTSLRNLITKIIDPADSAKAAAKALGIELSLAGVKAAGGFTEFIAQIRQATGGDITKLQAIFPEERSFRAASRLAGEVGSEFQRLSGIFTDVSQTAGATEKAFAIINETADQQWKLFKNNLSVAVADAGTSILDTFVPALQAVNDLLADRSELEKTIISLKALGVEGEKLKFLELRSGTQNAQKALKELDDQFAFLKADIETFGSAKVFGSLTESQASKQGARSILKEFEDILNTTEGFEQAQNRLVALDQEYAAIQIKIGEIQSGKLSVNLQEQQALEAQKERLEGQRDTLGALVNISGQRLALNDKIKSIETEISQASQAKTKEAAAAAEKTADLLQISRELGIAANEFTFLKTLEEQERAKENAEELLALERKRQEAAQQFVASQEGENAQRIARLLLDQVTSVTDIAKAEEYRESILNEIKVVYAEIDALLASGASETSTEVVALKEKAQALGEQKKVAEQTLAFLRSQYQVQQEQKQETLNIKSLSLEQLEEQLAALRQNKAENGELIKQVEKEIEGRKKSIELQRQAAEFIANTRNQIEVLEAGSDLERQLIQIRQQTEERVKMFGAQSEAAQAAYELERVLVKKAWDEFDKQANETIKKYQAELKGLKFDGIIAVLEPKLKLAVGSITFDERFDDDAFRMVRDHITSRLGEIVGSFDDFLVNLEHSGININDNLLNLSAIIYDGVNAFIPALNSYKDALGSTTSTIFDKLSSGLNALSIGASIALPLLKGIFGGNREARQQKALEEQRQKSEEARRALEAFNRELEETRRAAEDATLGKLQNDFEEITRQIRAMTNISRDLTKAEVERYTNLRIQEEGLLKAIQEARDVGDDITLNALLDDLDLVQGQLLELGFDLSHLSAAQLEDLKQLIEKQDVYNEAIKEFGKFADSFSGLMNKLNLAFDLFDVENPIQKLELLKDEVEKKFGALLPTTAEGIDDFVRRGFDAFERGGQELADFLTSMNLEELTADEFLELLRTLEGFGDEISKEVTPNIVKNLDDLLDRLRTEFDLLEIDVPTEKFNRFAQALNQSFGAAFTGSEEELRHFVEHGIKAFLDGGENLKQFLADYNLEELTAPEFETLLQSFKELLGEFDAAVQAQFDDIFSDLGLAEEFLGEDDPAENLRKLRERLNSEFEALIPQTEEQMRTFIAQGAQALITGGESLAGFLQAFGLEELTKDQLESLLRSLQGFVNDMNEEADNIEEIKEDKLGFGEVKTITFQQGNRFIDEVISMRIILTQMLEVMRTNSGFDPASVFSRFSGFRPGETRNHFYFINGNSIREVDQNNITPTDRAMMDRALAGARANGYV